MIDDHRRGAPLRLRAFARIVDDKRVEMGQGPQDRFGYRRRKAPLPCRAATRDSVLAVVDHGMRAERMPHPEIEGEVAVRRNERGVMIVDFGSILYPRAGWIATIGLAILLDRRWNVFW